MKRFSVMLLCSFLCGITGLAVEDVWAKKPMKFKESNIRAVSRLSHSGDIGGLVEDCSSDEVEGALVHIPGLSIMAKTDSQGMFRLLNVPVGTYDLMIEIPGQDPWSVHDIEVSPKRLLELGTLTVCGEGCSDNDDCSDDNYCAKDLGDCDGIGACEPRPEACLEIYDPVCGCNDNTYGNACMAAAAGMNIAYEGECQP